MVDSLINKQLKSLEKEFIEQRGIKERMHSARTGYRMRQDEELQTLRAKVANQEAEISRLRKLLSIHGIDDCEA